MYLHRLGENCSDYGQRGMKGASNVLSNFCGKTYILITQLQCKRSQALILRVTSGGTYFIPLNDSWAASEDSPAKSLPVGAVKDPPKTTPTSRKSPHVLVLWQIAQGERRERAFRPRSFSHVSIQKATCGRPLEGKPGPSAVSFLFLTFQTPSFFSIAFSSVLLSMCLGNCSGSIPSQCIF